MSRTQRTRPAGQAQSGETTPASGDRNSMQPNVAAIPKPTIPFPVLMAEKPKPPELFWLVRFGIRIGTLMTKPDNPKGWGWNPSVITLCILIGTLIGGGGYYIGHQAAVIEGIQKNAESAQDAANTAVRLMNQTDNSTPVPTPTRRK